MHFCPGRVLVLQFAFLQPLFELPGLLKVLLPALALLVPEALVQLVLERVAGSPELGDAVILVTFLERFDYLREHRARTLSAAAIKGILIDFKT